MSSNDRETPWWQTLIGIAVVGAGALAVNTIIDNQLEELENLPDRDIAAKITELAATLDENLWGLVIRKIEMRYSLQKFSHFAQSAWQLRRITDSLLESSGSDLEHNLVNVIMQLDEGSSHLFRRIIDLRSSQNSDATYLGKLMDRMGGIAAEVKQLLRLDVSSAQELLADVLYGMRPADRRLLIAILMNYSDQNPSLVSRALVGRAQRLHLQIGS